MQKKAIKLLDYYPSVLDNQFMWKCCETVCEIMGPKILVFNEIYTEMCKDVYWKLSNYILNDKSYTRKK